MGNRGFASAVLARRPATTTVARDGDTDEGPATRLARSDCSRRDEDRAGTARRQRRAPRHSVAPVEQLRQLRVRVATVRGLFDTDQPAGETAAQNWGGAMVQTVLARTLLDGLLFPGSDATLRLAWGKTLGTCRQLVGLLRAAEADAPPPEPGLRARTVAQPAAAPKARRRSGPSPPRPRPPPSPPIVVESRSARASSRRSARSVHGHVRHTEELEAVLDRFSDIPDKIYEAASGQEFGPVAALEFQKGLELVNQATLAARAAGRHRGEARVRCTA